MKQMNVLKVLVLLLMLSVATAAAESASGADTIVGGKARLEDMRLLLNAFTALTEEHIEGTLRGLKILSVSEEVRSGDWNAMKGLLTEFGRSGINAAAVWYARTDGRYYTVENGLTDQNISDRSYFPRLLAGNDVVGDLVISKSTGERAAVIAVPVRKYKKIVGILGVSVSADAMSRMLQGKMALPEDMVFYALDAHGQASIHRESSRLFVFPSDLGSRTLKRAVKEMLSRKEGTVRYEFHGEKTVVFKRSQMTDWVFAIGLSAGAAAGAAKEEAPPILSELADEITARLSKLDADLASAAKELSEAGLHNSAARKVLRDLCRSFPFAVDCAAVDISGRMVTVEPEGYRQFEGVDISDQEQVVRLRESKEPVMSKVIRTVEGFDAVDIERPVYSAQGVFAGSVSVLIRPEYLISDVAATLVQGLPIDVWAMQKDGRIIYDPDEEEIGRMLFDDPIYKPFPQLLSLGKVISKNRSGSGSYEFLGKGLKSPVRKDAYWTTVGLHGTEWRLVLTHSLAEEGSYAKRNLAELGVKPSEESLRDVAGSERLKMALAGNNTEEIRSIFKNFFAENYGIYSIQWVDPLGINRYGYPEENSPVNFNFHSLRTPSSKYILRAVSKERESSFEAPLAEGKKGLFFMIPVNKGKEYLGMVYIIRITQ
jgi:hypothetical protein